MKAGETLFGELIDGKQQLCIPIFQRPYTWEDKHLQVLWDDIMGEIEELELPDSKHEGHFIGSVVLEQIVGLPSGLRRYTVVDGQQRITSIMLLLAALRDATPDSQLSARIDDWYLLNSGVVGDDRLRLLPTRLDRQEYRNIIFSIGKIANDDEGVYHAYWFYHKRVSKLDPSRHHLLEKAIRTRIQLVEIVLDVKDDVYSVFESLNNKGKPLSQVDLVRNKLFSLLPQQEGEQLYEDVWIQMESLLGHEEGMRDLAWVNMVLRGNRRVKRESYYDAYSKMITEERWGAEQGEAEIRSMARLAHYMAVADGYDAVQGEVPAPTFEAIRRLRRWGTRTWLPVGTSLIKLVESGNTSWEEVTEAVGLSEAYLVRRMLMGSRTNNLNNVFSSIAVELNDVREGIVEWLHRKLSVNQRFWESDDVLITTIVEGDFYHYGEWRQQVFVLQALEESYGSKEPIDWRAAKLTIEHIMPQTLTPEWLAVLNEYEDPQGRTPQRLHEDLVDTLGNLTITASNSELSNLSYERKRQILASTSLAMNRRILESEKWGPTEILARGRELAERITKIWSAPYEQEDVPSTAGFWQYFVSRAGDSYPWLITSDIKGIQDADEEGWYGTFIDYDVERCVGYTVGRVDGSTLESGLEMSVTQQGAEEHGLIETTWASNLAALQSAFGEGTLEVKSRDEDYGTRLVTYLSGRLTNRNRWDEYIEWFADTQRRLRRAVATVGLTLPAPLPQHAELDDGIS